MDDVKGGIVEGELMKHGPMKPAPAVARIFIWYFDSYWQGGSSAFAPLTGIGKVDEQAQSGTTGARHKSGIAGVMWGRLAACAAVGYRRSVVQARAVGRLTIGCSLPSCPTPSSPSLVYTYARIPAVS
jgi:hypothetical protein